MNPRIANRRQLEILRRTLSYEIEVMESLRISACKEILQQRLKEFEDELEKNTRYHSDVIDISTNLNNKRRE
ncbi:hypothetical protein HP567_028870 [Brevibacillus sp. M2.1A]|uniref:hypothetical protein n=1 Tax=Brevibacillus sp. M2.1A TaxID=2738980 RepID=UPI00156B009B|nr:hypothetical protein [Brevibacillus sp. M2.1A]MCC8438552.1 hypothetical protein [Brevibacillus sp. M2.1A]